MRRKFGKIKPLGSISCLLLSASLQSQVKLFDVSGVVGHFTNWGHIINITAEEITKGWLY